MVIDPTPVKLTVPPAHIVVGDTLVVTVGKAFTVIELVVTDAEHPLLLVAVNVNVPPVVPIVTLGL